MADFSWAQNAGRGPHWYKLPCDKFPSEQLKQVDGDYPSSKVVGSVKNNFPTICTNLAQKKGIHPEYPTVVYLSITGYCSDAPTPTPSREGVGVGFSDALIKTCRTSFEVLLVVYFTTTGFSFRRFIVRNTPSPTVNQL